jgi:hypothetical protein
VVELADLWQLSRIEPNVDEEGDAKLAIIATLESLLLLLLFLLLLLLDRKSVV